MTRPWTLVGLGLTVKDMIRTRPNGQSTGGALNDLALEVNNNELFEQVFFASRACIDAAQYCLLFIALDNCHTKSRFHMMLFSAIALDSNDQLFCIA
jgi:hypothetical protein